MTAPFFLSDDVDRKETEKQSREKTQCFHELDLSPDNQANNLLMLQHSSDKDHS